VTSRPDPTLFERLGGEAALRAIIDDFVERIFADVMIGYFFSKADKARVKAKEYEFAARHLGLDVPYTGTPLPAAHARHDIRGGHFMRRLQILKETLEKHGAPPEVIEHWLSHTEQMRAAITQQQGSDCSDPTTSPTKAEPEAAPPSPPQPEPNAKAIPSVAEIQAYLEQSAARTKLRLPLAFGSSSSTNTSNPAPMTVAQDRALPITRSPSLTQSDPGAPARTKTLPVTKASTPATPDPTRKPR
jgi:hemoglobin